jgi:peptidoglycan hydrolase CwlO-like protein
MNCFFYFSLSGLLSACVNYFSIKVDTDKSFILKQTKAQLICMSKKQVSTSVIALAIICVLLTVSVTGIYFYQNSIITNKTSTYDSYVASHTQTDTEFATLQSQYSSLQSQFTSLQESLETYISTHSHNDSGYTFLKSTLDSLQSTYNSLQSTYNAYVSSHNHIDSEYNSITSQLANATSQITTLQTWLNGNVSALVNANNQLISTTSQLANANSQLATQQAWLDGNVSALANANNQITSLQNQITSLNSQIGTLQTWLTGNLTALANANSQINTLNTQINNLNAIATLQKSTIWLNNQTFSIPANQPTALTYNYQANYAGYFAITVQSSRTTNLGYKVSINGQYFSFSGGGFGLFAGESYTMCFPIIQLGNVKIILGSYNDAVDGTIAITYYY